ncbi:hypothetical protein Taro_019635 [Colocasia esculenta]|uniref:Non-specific lipid-transfer protein n=1 Tax=Colocasia esculenta TaxID=4460 RepID=A0A843UZR8_COLES|nr:hypothetical protein [Colocasia esculenta]
MPTSAYINSPPPAGTRRDCKPHGVCLIEFRVFASCLRWRGRSRCAYSLHLSVLVMAAAGGSRVLVAAAVIMCLLVAAAPGAAGITCGQVAGGLGPCIQYIRGRAPAPPPACCAGIRNLNAAANTPAARRDVCNCLKTIGRAISGLNPGLAAGVPGKCGVKVPFPISFSTDCTKIKRWRTPAAALHGVPPAVRASLSGVLTGPEIN